MIPYDVTEIPPEFTLNASECVVGMTNMCGTKILCMAGMAINILHFYGFFEEKFLLVFIPVLLWLGMIPLKFRFGGVIAICTSLGQLAALAGMVLFSWSLILSARLKFFDRYLGGLNRVYVNHHRIGAAAFVLLLFHPLFLTVRLGAHSLVMAAKFWLPSGNWALNFGLAALFGMMVLLILTFFVSLKYSAWKNTHKYLVIL